MAFLFNLTLFKKESTYINFQRLETCTQADREKEYSEASDVDKLKFIELATKTIPKLEELKNSIGKDIFTNVKSAYVDAIKNRISNQVDYQSKFILNQNKQPAAEAVSNLRATVSINRPLKMDSAYASSQIRRVIFEVTHHMLLEKISVALSPTSFIQALSIHVRIITGEQLHLFKTIFKCENVTNADFFNAFDLINKEISAMNNEYFKYMSANAFASTDASHLKNASIKGKLIYGTSPEDVQKKTNEWIAIQTDNLIPNFIGKPVDEALANAVSFNFKWANIFKKEKTKLAPFTFEEKLDGENSVKKTVNVLTMEMDYLLSQAQNPVSLDEDPLHQFYTGMRFLETDKYTALSLPLITNKTQFVEDYLDLSRLSLQIERGNIEYEAKELIILPKPGFDLSEVSEELTCDSIVALEDKMTRPKGIHLKLPLLNVNSMSGSLADALALRAGPEYSPKHIGFSPGSDLRQQMKFDQDELGIRGGIATATQLKGGTFKDFIVDKPFMYAIIHGKNVIGLGTIKDDRFLVKKRT